MTWPSGYETSRMRVKDWSLGIERQVFDGRGWIRRSRARVDQKLFHHSGKEVSPLATKKKAAKKKAPAKKTAKKKAAKKKAPAKKKK